MMTRPTLHLRVPQGADAVESEASQPGNTAPPLAAAGPRTLDAVQKPDDVQKVEDGILAELDRGPMGA
jgi:hypothetical protein